MCDATNEIKYQKKDTKFRFVRNSYVSFRLFFFISSIVIYRLDTFVGQQTRECIKKMSWVRFIHVFVLMAYVDTWFVTAIKFGHFLSFVSYVLFLVPYCFFVGISQAAHHIHLASLDLGNFRTVHARCKTEESGHTKNQRHTMPELFADEFQNTYK